MVLEKVRKNHIFFRSGNFEIGQGNLKIKQEVREFRNKFVNELNIKN